MGHTSISNVLPSVASPLIRQPGSSLWDIPVLITAPASEADRLLVTFVRDCRRMAQVRSLDAILSPIRANVRPLLKYHPASPTQSPPGLQKGGIRSQPLSPAVSGPTADHPITSLATSLCDNVGMTSIFERLAVFAPIRSVVSWLAHPTTETSLRLGENFKPTRLQLSVPHSQWIDLIQWAPLRDRLIQEPDRYDTKQMQVDYSKSLRLVNWPGRQVDALEFDERTGDVWLSDGFMAHAEDSRNWRLCSEFAGMYPELRSLVCVEGDV